MIKSRKESSGMKHLDASLAWIARLYRNKKIVLIKANSLIINIEGRLAKKSNEFIVTSSRIGGSKIFHKPKRVTKIKARWGAIELVLENLFVRSRFPDVFEAEVGNVKSKGFSDKVKQFQRLIIPTKSRIDFFTILERRAYKTEKFRGSKCVRANFEKFFLDIYVYKNEKEHSFLIIDSPIKISHDEFSEAAFASLVSLGYITGKLVQEEGIYFNYSSRTMDTPTAFKFASFRPSIESIFYPVSSNPFGFGIKGRKGDLLYKKIKPISELVFSKLCQLVLQKNDLRAALLMLMESIKGSVFTMAAGMAVILETLTNLYAEENPDYFVLIKEQKLSSTILGELRSVIVLHKNEIGDVETKVMDRINQINQVSNMVKLTKPFQMLGFVLNEDDRMVIERRNDLLHGRLTLNYGVNIDEADKEMYLIATKLYTLINILILKQVSFAGHIINWPVYNKHVHKRKLSEDVFRQI